MSLPFTAFGAEPPIEEVPAPRPNHDEMPTEDFGQRLDRVLGELDEQRRQRLDALRKQIEMLDKILGAKAATPGEESPSTPLAKPHEPPPPATPSAEASSPHGEANHPAKPKPTPIPTEQALGGDPVDPLALADSLFGADEIQLALETYRALPPDKRSETDRRWIQYQIASCLRRLDQTGAAEQAYRELLAEKNNDLLGVQARWWLDTIERHKRLRTSLQGLETTLGTLKAEK
jgi:hypothetical protein